MKKLHQQTKLYQIYKFTIRGEWRDHSSMPQISTFEHSYNMNDWVSDTKYPEEIMNSTLPVSREETISIIAVPPKSATDPFKFRLMGLLTC